MEWKRNRVRFINKPPSFCSFSIFFFFFTISALFCTITSSTTITCPDNRCPLSAKVDAYFQELEKPAVNKKMMMMTMLKDESEGRLRIERRRYLSGPGSSPPRCTAKCGSCTPCKPVHVPVPPGTPVTAEYYPEAWRCKCGNKLYMP